MSGYHCPSCGDMYEIFGANSADEIIEDYEVGRLACLPVHPAFGSESGEENTRRVAAAHDRLDEASRIPSEVSS